MGAIKKTIATIGLCTVITNNLHGEINAYAKKQPLIEEKIENVKREAKINFGSTLPDIDIGKSLESGSFEVPLPSTRTIVIDQERKSDDKYAIREMRIKESIHYYEAVITLYTLSYTLKEQSATFIVRAGEEEKKIKVGLKQEETFDYVIPDMEQAWRLHIKLEEIKVPDNKIVVKLLREKIKPQQVNQNNSEFKNKLTTE